jgi:nicotinate-nucleotide adenylyltransferase
LDKKRKIGIFGGTFDPVHKGHLAVARGVLNRYRLDEIFFIPAPYPPHKQQPLTDFSHRVAMLESVLADEPGISISLVETERLSPSYTIDTLLELRDRIGDHRFFLIIGADSFIEMHLWQRYEDLFRLADIVVAARPGIDLETLGVQVESFPGDFQYDPEKETWFRGDGFHIYYFSAIHMAMSSSAIRRRLIQGEDVSTLLPPAVAEYIRRNNLYAGR